MIIIWYYSVGTSPLCHHLISGESDFSFPHHWFRGNLPPETPIISVRLVVRNPLSCLKWSPKIHRFNGFQVELLGAFTGEGSWYDQRWVRCWLKKIHRIWIETSGADKIYYIWLVVWNIFPYFSQILGIIIIPIDYLIFFRGLGLNHHFGCGSLAMVFRWP